MNFRQIEVFRAVMIGGTATEAARLLRTSQPAVSRTLRQLEHAVEFKLFELRRGRLVPTPEAKALFREVERSYTGLDRIRAASATLRDAGVGRLSVAAIPSIGMNVLPKVVADFLKRHPGVAISLQTQSSDLVRDGVAGSTYDLGFAAREIDTTGVRAQPFLEVQAVCTMRAGHPLARRRVVRARDLSGFPLVMLNRSDASRRRIDQVLAAAGVPPQPIVETTYGITICELALEGVGVGLVNPIIASDYIERGLVVRPFEPAVLFSIFLLQPLAIPTSRLAAEFTAGVAAALRGRPGMRVLRREEARPQP
jgi:DNA-binding transcriptional LysR family regulator